MTNSCIIGNKNKYLFILNIKWILKDQIIMQRVLLKSSHLIAFYQLYNNKCKGSASQTLAITVLCIELASAKIS